MKSFASIDKLFDSIKTSFWFIPLIMVVTSIVSAWLIVWIDHSQAWGKLDWFTFLYETDQSTLLSLVNTIAASMITVTSIAFSITIVTLTLASSQFGPRLIRNFMDDRGTQLVLGTFISNFSYCMVLIYCMSLDSNQGIKMGLSIIWCLIATLCSVFILIYFIHHVARSIQADNVINELCREINRSIEPLFKLQPTSGTQYNIDRNFIHSFSVEAKQGGYLQVLSSQKLCKLAQTHDMLIEFHWRPGDLINKNSELAVLKSHKPLAEDLDIEINQCCVIGSTRTPIQDPEYAIHQMVEIAVRALSTGVNDPYTAITCVDKLCLVLCDLATRDLHQGHYLDEDGVLRLISRPYGFSGLTNSAFDQIRQYAQDSVAVTIRLLESLHRIAVVSDKPAIHQVLLQQLKAIQQIKDKAKYTDKDNQDFEQSVQKITRELSFKT